MTNTETFVAAYAAANKIAQDQDVTSPAFKGAYVIAEELGFTRETMEWEAAVGGAAAFFFNGDRL